MFSSSVNFNPEGKRSYFLKKGGGGTFTTFTAAVYIVCFYLKMNCNGNNLIV